ncbi:MAG: DUF5717 family protein [bacterium]|nr:DUF5717 family protein [bacterium]
MRERINKLARGIVEQEVPSLLVKPARIEADITLGTVGSGELLVSSENGLSIKGILYSTHSRVKATAQTFHKLQNSIVYEVDTSYMENGDSIEGVFHVVSNAGEMEIPYSFHICLAAAGKLLESLKTVEDFAAIARSNWQMARNLFVYRSFPEAPFMKEMHTRTLYECLVGSVNPNQAMEEFLLALKAKEAVQVLVDASSKNFFDIRERKTGQISLKRNAWGFVRIVARAEGAFIRLQKAELTEEDFDGETAKLSFEILPEKMHRGNNYGSIEVWTKEGCVKVDVKASLYQQKELGGYPLHMAHGYWIGYLKERLCYECGAYSKKTFCENLQVYLDRMEAGRTVSEPWLSLLRAELLLESGQTERASLLLAELRGAMMKERAPMAKALYQYLRWGLHRGKEEGEQLEKALRQWLLAEPNNYFYLYLLEKVDEKAGENVFECLKQYRMLFVKGCRSPFLYLRVCQIFNRDPSLLRQLGAFEFQSLWFGCSYGLITKDLAIAATTFVRAQYCCEKKYFKLFSSFYERYPSEELLSAVLQILIQGDVRKPWAFVWYEKGIKTGMALTRLYEYYLYTLPQNYAQPLPMEVLLYFSYASSLDEANSERLYENLLLYWKTDSPVYQLYELSMEHYALKQLFERKVSRSLALLYERLLYPEMIDLPVAEVLPDILNTYRIVCENPQMKYVLVCSEELTGCDAYTLKNGEAYVPLYEESSLILFQDVYGERYATVPFQKEAVLNHPDYLQKCFDIYPQHPMLRLLQSRRLLRGRIQPSQSVFLEQLLREMPVRPLFRQQVLEKILESYHYALDEGKKLDVDLYLLEMSKEELSKRERGGIARVLIAQNHMDEAYQMLCHFGMDDIKGNDARKLISRVVMQEMGKKDEYLLQKAFAVFEDDKADEMILDYLCKHYNGSTGEMYAILETAIREKAETYDLEERLLGQMLFTGSTESYLDNVFEWYTSRKKQDSTLVKAYFTSKCMDYFMNETEVPSKIFLYLESMVRKILYRAKIPDIYQLALTRHYSEQESLSQEQARLCASMVQNLLTQRKVFPYFQKLTKWAEIPDDLMDKTIMEYHGKPNVRPVVLLRLLPDESNFHAETMRHMYRGIYIKEKILFADETMEYKVAEETMGTLKIVTEGSIESQRFPADGVINRITCINEICRSLPEDEEEKAKEKMQEYERTTAMARMLFEL